MSQTRPTRYSDLFREHQRVVRLMQTVGFGRILNLVVRAGEPSLGTDSRVIRTLRMSATGDAAGVTNGPRAEATLRDFELKREVVEFLAHVDAVRDGVIPRVEIAHGLPLLIEVEQSTDLYAITN